MSLLQLRATDAETDPTISNPYWFDPSIPLEKEMNYLWWPNPTQNPWFPYGPPAPDGKPDLEQTDTMVKRGPCNVHLGEPN